MTRLPQPSTHGFTLIEAMLAIGIMAVVLVAVNAVFFSALRLRDRTSAAVDRDLPVQQATEVLRRDLRCAMPPGGLMAGDFKVGNVTSANQGIPVAIELYTATGALRADQPWGDVQLVTYALRPPTSTSRSNGGNDLIRSVTRNLLCTATPVVEDQCLQSGLQDIRFACYDGTQWLDSWDTTSGNTNLPLAVRVTLRPINVPPSEAIVLVVPVVSQSRTNQLQPVVTGGGA